MRPGPPCAFAASEHDAATGTLTTTTTPDRTRAFPSQDANQLTATGCAELDVARTASPAGCCTFASADANAA